MQPKIYILKRTPDKINELVFCRKKNEKKCSKIEALPQV